MKHFALLAALAWATVVSAQTRYYVNHAATGANSGLSWADAFNDLQQALAIAQDGDEIWVAQGTYKPTLDDNRAAYFEVPSGVRLYGGFAGTETQLEQRDWTAFPTALDGDIGIPGDTSDNAYTVVFMPYSDEGTLLDGFIIRNGNANGHWSVLHHIDGGGLYILADNGEAYPDIRNCRFERNYAVRVGGAVEVNVANSGTAFPRFEHCVFTDNYAGGSGGAIGRGGGSWINRGAFLYHCRFERNSANNYGGAVTCGIGTTGSDTLLVQNCIFEDNYAGRQGGGLYISTTRTKNLFIWVDSCIFRRNISPQGAALNMIHLSPSTEDGEMKISNSSFIENMAEEVVLHILLDLIKYQTIQNCEFIQNSNSQLSPLILITALKNAMVFLEDVYISRGDFSTVIFRAAHFSVSPPTVINRLKIVDVKRPRIDNRHADLFINRVVLK